MRDHLYETSYFEEERLEEESKTEAFEKFCEEEGFDPDSQQAIDEWVQFNSIY